MNATMSASTATEIPSVVFSVREIPLDKICESKTNPRRDFDETKLAELADSIRQHGVLQAVVVRPHSETAPDVYELVAGTRRYRAAKLVGRETTLLNILGKFIANDERIVLIEDTAEIHLNQLNLVRFEARQVQDGRPAVSIRDLLKASLRHRPDRIVLGEIRGSEAFDLLQLLNTGHSGTLSTIHANSAKQGLSRFTSCVLQSGIELPYRAIKNNIGDSLNVVIQIERRPGLRFVSEVLEIRQYDADKDSFELTPIYVRSPQSKELP